MQVAAIFVNGFLPNSFFFFGIYFACIFVDNSILFGSLLKVYSVMNYDVFDSVVAEKE